MSIAKLAEYAENIFTIVFSVLWILAFLAAFVLGILWVIVTIKEKKEKARNEQLDCGSCIYFLRRMAISKEFDALREDSAKERENKLEENDAAEKKKIYDDGRTVYFDEQRTESGNFRNIGNPIIIQENDATEKKEYEDVRIELSEDKQEQDEPSPESEVAE